ncbi:MAG: SGNH/GDSL hydrolase family protein [Chloroflexi bacterium]|nr:SGNH/GDSL hydrolase family protein [Chloroflexota bacterium]
MVRLAGLALLAIVIIACGSAPPAPQAAVTPVPATTPAGSAVPSGAAAGLRYVALGDSFTIGTSVAVDARWPDQLVTALGPTPPTLDLVANLGVNGFTSRYVIDVELPQLDALRPQFLTLLVGVNDVVQGVPVADFRRNAVTTLDDLVRRVGAERVLVVTTPDYTVTPAGADYGDPATRAAAIRTSNEILSGLATARGIAVVDIYDLSLRAAGDRSLVAGDGLHPSGAQYALWVARILPVVRDLLGRAP